MHASKICLFIAASNFQDILPSAVTNLFMRTSSIIALKIAFNTRIVTIQLFAFSQISQNILNVLGSIRALKFLLSVDVNESSITLPVLLPGLAVN